MMKKSIFLFCVLFSFQGIATAQSNKIDSLRALLRTAGEDTNKVNILNLLSYEILYSNTDTALYYTKLAKDLAEKLNYRKGIASVYLRLGQIYNNLGSYDQSQAYLTTGLTYSTDKLITAKIYVNMGINHYEMSNYPEALNNYLTGLKAFEEAGDKKAVGSVYNNIALIYTDMGKYDEALKNHLAARKIREKNNDKRGIATSYLNIGTVYLEQGNDTAALQNFFEAKKLYEELGDKNEIAMSYNHIGIVYKRRSNYAEALKNYYAALKIQEEAGDKEGMADSYEKIGTALAENNKPREAREWLLKGLKLAKEIGTKTTIQDAYLGLSIVDSLSGNFKDAFENRKMYAIYHDSMANKAVAEKIVQQKMQYEFDKKETQSKAEQALTLKELQRQKLVRNGFVGGFAVVLLFALLFLAQRNKIKIAKKRSDELLLNILPEETAEELKAKGSADAKYFDEVTVMFTDFKNFTQISEKLSPSELVAEIHKCFKAFDDIIGKHNIEKIKTIGDSYMCAGGLPVANKTNAVDVVNASKELQQFMLEHLNERKRNNKEPFEIRIGIHTGPVVAGIVGIKKFAYDIWGDTVNIASRMESSGEPGKINISGSTYEHVKNTFKCTYRGKVQAKNKGEIDMYFVE
jgi:adenylate cyclase